MFVCLQEDSTWRRLRNSLLLFFFRLMVLKLSRCLVNVVVVVMCVLCRVDIQAKFEGEEEKENVGRLSKW